MSPEFLEYLYDALRSPRGIVLRTNDVERLRAKLYATRKETLDPDLEVLSFIPSPTDPSELWLVRKGAPNAGT